MHEVQRHTQEDNTRHAVRTYPRAVLALRATGAAKGVRGVESWQQARGSARVALRLVRRTRLSDTTPILHNLLTSVRMIMTIRCGGPANLE